MVEKGSQSVENPVQKIILLTVKISTQATLIRNNSCVFHQGKKNA